MRMFLACRSLLARKWRNRFCPPQAKTYHARAVTVSELSAVQSTSLDAIFATHRHVFIKIAERIVGCRSRAEDVVHDAFVKLIANGEKYTIDSRVGYLTRIVYNQAVGEYRRRTTEDRVVNGGDAKSVMVSEAAPPESISMHRQTLQLVASALAELPERTRYAFEEHRFRGVSQKDIAANLGVSPTLVNFMIRDATVHCRSRVTSLAA